MQCHLANKEILIFLSYIHRPVQLKASIQFTCRQFYNSSEAFHKEISVFYLFIITSKYLGNSEVIHRLGDHNYTCCRHFSAKSANSASGDVYEGVSIRQEKFLDVAGKNKAYIANDWDNRRK